MVRFLQSLLNMLPSLCRGMYAVTSKMSTCTTSCHPPCTLGTNEDFVKTIGECRYLPDKPEYVECMYQCVPGCHTLASESSAVPPVDSAQCEPVPGDASQQLLSQLPLRCRICHLALPVLVVAQTFEVVGSQTILLTF